MIELKQQHSPGPWLPGIKDSDAEKVVSGGVVIAEIIPTDCTAQEFQANCSLIYAAPDLLECLDDAILDSEEKLADMKEGLKHGFYTPSDYAQKEREIARAKNAVAKAKAGAA